MDKLKLKPIDPLMQSIKKKDPRPSTPAYHNYPSDLKFRILPGLCKTNGLYELSEDVANLTRLIKTEKPLTLKPNKYF